MRRLAAALLAGAAALAACGGELRDGELSVIGDASLDYALPGETLAEWAEHGEQLSVIRVTSDTRPVEWPAYKDSGGLVGRKVTVRIEDTLWRQGKAAAPRRVLTFGVWGWMYDDDQDPDSVRNPLVAEGSVRMRVGSRYLAVLTRHRREWAPLRDSAVMTLGRDGRVTSEVDAGEPSPAAAAMRGLTPAEAGAALTAAERE